MWAGDLPLVPEKADSSAPRFVPLCQEANRAGVERQVPDSVEKSNPICRRRFCKGPGGEIAAANEFLTLAGSYPTLQIDRPACDSHQLQEILCLPSPRANPSR